MPFVLFKIYKTISVSLCLSNSVISIYLLGHKNNSYLIANQILNKIFNEKDYRNRAAEQ